MSEKDHHLEAWLFVQRQVRKSERQVRRSEKQQEKVKGK
jgi:hypothetical protein